MGPESEDGGVQIWEEKGHWRNGIARQGKHCSWEMPGGTTVPYKKTKHKTFNAFRIKRFSGQYQIQTKKWGEANRGNTVLGKPSSATVTLLSEEAVWRTQYIEKSKCTFIKKTLSISRLTLQIAVNMKINENKTKQKNPRRPLVLKERTTCSMHIHVKAEFDRQRERGRKGKSPDRHCHPCRPSYPSLWHLAV